MPDGSESKSGNSLLGILRHSKKEIKENCIICHKEIGKDVDYIILNDLSPYYWHIECLIQESPDFLVIYKTKTITKNYFRTVKLFIKHLQTPTTDYL